MAPEFGIGEGDEQDDHRADDPGVNRARARQLGGPPGAEQPTRPDDGTQAGEHQSDGADFATNRTFIGHASFSLESTVTARRGHAPCQYSSMLPRPHGESVKNWLHHRLFKPLLALLSQGIAPDRLALCVAIGVVVGNIPILGVSTILCGAVALAFRLNLPAIQIVQAAMAPDANTSHHSLRAPGRMAVARASTTAVDQGGAHAAGARRRPCDRGAAGRDSARGICVDLAGSRGDLLAL